jgi:hypothetical protein
MTALITAYLQEHGESPKIGPLSVGESCCILNEWYIAWNQLSDIDVVEIL